METEPRRASLQAVRRCIPSSCYRASPLRASLYLVMILGGLFLAEGFAVLTWTSGAWLLFPLNWALTGTLFTSLFIITHDCGHEAFFPSPRLNRLVGHLVSAPLLYPYWQWRHWHDAHHRHANLGGQTFVDQMRGEIELRRDTAFTPETFPVAAPRRRGLPWWIYVISRRAPPLAVLWIPVLLGLLFPIKGSRHRRRYLVSLAFTAAVGLMLTALILGLSGSVWALFHFWLIPLAVHACWLGYYAFTQHTAPEIRPLNDTSWTPLEAQLRGTVNTLVPRWISFLHSDPEFHVVHHLAPKVPSYHMRSANEALRRSPFADLVRDVPFSLRQFLEQTRRCHLWDPATDTYRRFSDSGALAPDPERARRGAV